MCRGNGDTVDGSLEFDQWMCSIVSIVGQGLAIGTKVSVIAYGALVSITLDVSFEVGAERSITVDSTVELSCSTYVRKRSIESGESMTRVLLGSRSDTCHAEIKIGTRQALVTDTVNALYGKSVVEPQRDSKSTHLVTAVAKGIVTNATAGCTEGLDLSVALRVVLWLKGVRWIMAMFTVLEAAEAQIEVRAILAGHEVTPRQF